MTIVSRESVQTKDFGAESSVRFSALDKTGSGLTVAPPEAFGFLDKTSGRIAVDGSQLQLKPGKTLSLVGGDIDINGEQHVISIPGWHNSSEMKGFIAVEGGQINLTSTASAGQVGVSDGTIATEGLG